MRLRKIIKIVERSWYFLRLPILLVLTVTIIHTFFLTIFIVDGRSMYPTLKDKQVLIVNKIYYLMVPPLPGDIVIMQFPGDPSRRMFVKRVFGVPGDKIKSNSIDKYGEVSSKELSIKLGEYYVLGDNRLKSGDSRYWGTVPRENIIGKVISF